jgi:hypothetical protein
MKAIVSTVGIAVFDSIVDLGLLIIFSCHHHHNNNNNRHHLLRNKMVSRTYQLLQLQMHRHVNIDKHFHLTHGIVVTVILHLF